MGWFSKLFRRERSAPAATSTRSAPAAAPPRPAASATEKDDAAVAAHVASCIEPKFTEQPDNRWFSDFPELREIDNAREAGRLSEALERCNRGLESHPDSFLFYGRAAQVYDAMGDAAGAERVLLAGIDKSLSKCSLCGHLAEQARKQSRHADAVAWWLRGCSAQLRANLLADNKPFMNLAYVCRPLGLGAAADWLLGLADRISRTGPIRLDAVGTRERGEVAAALGNGPAHRAVLAFVDRYQGWQPKPPEAKAPIKVDLVLEESNAGETFRVYQAASDDDARKFLESATVDSESVFIIVATPKGYRGKCAKGDLADAGERFNAFAKRLAADKPR